MRHQDMFLQTALRDKRSELARVIRAHSSQIIVDGSEHEFVDQIQGMSRREEAVTFMNALTRTLAAVDSALRAMKDGSYGSCPECGDAISSRRLEAIPWAANCIECQKALIVTRTPGELDPVGTMPPDGSRPKVEGPEDT